VVRDFSKLVPFSVRYRFEKRQGQAYARNAGIEEARGRVLAFTDDDTLPAANWVAGLMAKMASGDLDGVGGSVLPLWEESPPVWLTRRPHLWFCLALTRAQEPMLLTYPVRAMALIVGANMAFKRTIFEQFGGFDTALGHRGHMPYGQEETAFVNELLKSGRAIAFDPEIRVSHRITRRRMRRSFFVRRVFCHEAASAWLEPAGAPSGVTMLFGVERWRYRSLIGALARTAWRQATHQPTALEAQLDLARDAGSIWGQLVRRHRRGRTGPRQRYDATRAN
jgi:glycosyltransferase involved in cell wall biosynthesis